MDLIYKTIFTKRKKLAITVERDSSIVVHAPIGTSEEKIRDILESKKLWLYEKTRHSQKYKTPPQAPGKELVSGESMPYLGKNYQLEVVDTEFENIQFSLKFIVTKTKDTDPRALFKKWYIKKANEKISVRVKEHAKKLGVEYNEIKISDVKYRWGSCTPNNNLIFNWRLIKAPMYVIDYIIVHELTHLIEANHTPIFWTIVKTNVPHYEKSKAWLKDHGDFLEQEL